ncbi:MAG: spermidine/putrescine ABC transporter substrate-binding protein [Chloroflexi bacterium]|nr:spermidine/putrescine ABC transporter substrate-binding protein [Chloroflexota bacterium]
MFYDWPDYMPQAVMDAFTAEYGIKIDHQVYGSQKEAVDNIRANKVYDVVVIDNDLIPPLLTDHILAEIDLSHLSNFKNISANFRDLAYDPGNKHTVPFNWGTTGLLARSDLLTTPITRWADLWDPQYAGKVAIWALQRPLIPIALKRLGYSVNSENPLELEKALQVLIELKPNVRFVDLDQGSVGPTLVSGKVILAYGWAYDALTSQHDNQHIEYILPSEGTILWGDNLVIPANSLHKEAAELFINFILQPENGGKIVNELYYANANEAARAFIKPEILNNPLVFPPDADLKNAEIMMAPSPAGQKLYDEIWKRFLAATPVIPDPQQNP